MKADRTIDDAGNVVERYIYDPYGRTEIAAVTFYHDHDLDGDIDASDVAHYDWCTSSGFPERAQDPMCVFVHNRDGDYELTAADGTLFAAYVASPSYNSNGAPPPEEWERLRTAYLDANNDQVINLYDWYAFQVCEGVTTSTGGMNDHLCLYLFDLDGDDDVDLNEGQQGCNLFTGQWNSAGDGRPGQATGSRFGNPFMWTGQRYDAPVGLYHFLFRSYSPTLGRWLQRDPLGYVDGATLYGYVLSNPTSLFDPFGLDSLGPIGPEIQKIVAELEPPIDHDKSPDTPPDHMKKSQVGTPEEFSKELKRHVDDSRLSLFGVAWYYTGASGNRYVWTSHSGWLDMQHFIASFHLQAIFGRYIAWTFGTGKEFVFDLGSPSFFSREDMKSNRQGRLFRRWWEKHFVDRINPETGKPYELTDDAFYKALRDWLEGKSPLPPWDPKNCQPNTNSP